MFMSIFLFDLQFNCRFDFRLFHIDNLYCNDYVHALCASEHVDDIISTAIFSVVCELVTQVYYYCTFAKNIPWAMLLVLDLYRLGDDYMYRP